MENMPSDADLVRDAQAGNVASLGVLLERHRAGMYAVALRLLGHSPEAQDAVQEAILVALQRLSDLRDPGSAGPWLRAIVRNICRMHRRAFQPVHTDISAISVVPSQESLPEELLERQALHDWIWHAVEDLSEPLRLVVLLRYFSEITAYDQIAALCGIPVGTVRSRLHQARLKLADALLATANNAHDNADALVSRRQQEVTELFAAAERGDFGSALAAICSPELAVVWPQGQRQQGLAPLIHAMTSDLEAGVLHRPAQVTASGRITVIEADLVSPPWDPDHCPPELVWLLSLRDNRVQHIRLFHPQLAVPLAS